MTEETDRPNILLLMPDQHRPDAIGAVDPVVQTPTLDRIADGGVRFDRAYCQGPLCMPSRASLLTGRYVRDHGVNDNTIELAGDEPTFLHALDAAGYHNAAVGKLHLYGHSGRARHTSDQIERLHRFGFHEAFETVGKVATANVRSPYTDFLEEQGLYQQYVDWMQELSKRVQLEDGRPARSRPAWTADPCPLPPETYQDAWVGTKTVEWIEQYSEDKPFFLQVGFPGPHSPFDAPAAYVERYRDADVKIGSLTPPELPDHEQGRDFFAAHLSLSSADTITEERVRELRRYYYANVTLIDEHVGRILDALERRGELERTWVIYTTDHGEMLGDHRLLSKITFYEPSAGVPLIVRPPGGMSGRVEPRLVEQLDLTATMRAIAGAPDDPESEGRSLLGHFDAGGDGGFTRDVAVSENHGFAMFATQRFKIVVWEDTLEPVQLFDLEQDPAEDHSLVSDPTSAPLIEELMEQHVRPFFVTAPKRLKDVSLYRR